MTTQEVKRKLTAILSADVKGYSRLMGVDEEATVRTLNAYKKVMTKLIQRHNGRVVEAPGDNVLAEFASVVDALRCAVEIQKELKARNANLPENRRMEFRIGVNLGDVIEDGKQILGDGVNIAARVQGLADGGGICISGTAFDHVRNKIDLGYEYLGEQTVKNITLPVRVYKVLIEPEAAGKVIGEKKAKPRQWQMVTMGLVLGVIVLVAAAVIRKLYTPSAPQPEITLKEKVVASPPEKVPTVVPPSTEVAPKEKVTPPSPEKASKTITPSPPVDKADPKKMALPLPDKPSIAVLPFVNMSDDPKQEFFSDGLTEEIITALSKTPKLFVIARNSSFVYKGKPVNVQQVSRELGVKYVLEGSVRRSGDQLRITAQLIDAITGSHLWAERYDREMKDIFAIQDDITTKVTSTLNVKLTDGEIALLLGKGTKNLEAYLKMIQARELVTRGNKEDNAQAKRLIEEVITLDPSYAMAYAMLAMSYFYDVAIVASQSPGESIARGIEMAQKAISLDQKTAFPHGVLAQFYHLKKDWDKAVSEAEIGVALEPNSSYQYGFLGNALIYSSRYEEAVLAYEKSIRLDPFPSMNTLIGYANCLRMIGRYEESVATFKKLIQWRPDNLLGHIGLTGTYSMMGRDADAQAQAKEVLRINPNFSMEGFSKRTAYKNLDDWNRYMDALRKAGLK
jgi:TolB-like protein/class 3 adenylate cyclase/Tfp pilus assembly protein PilF